MQAICPEQTKTDDSTVILKKPAIPLLLRFREKIGGQVKVNPQCSDDSTYMGSTQCPGSNGVADYQSD